MNKKITSRFRDRNKSKSSKSNSKAVFCLNYKILGTVKTTLKNSMKLKSET